MGKGAWASIWVLDWADKKYVEQNIILYEGASLMYRVILLSTNHSADPESRLARRTERLVRRNDTLVVDAIGFNGRTWRDPIRSTGRHRDPTATPIFHPA